MWSLQTGQEAWFQVNHVSIHVGWNAWRHLGSSTRLSPSINSSRQTWQSVVASPARKSLCGSSGIGG